MGIRFSKSIKIGKLLKLNISKSGVSATIGPKGATINLGSKGTYLNLSPTVAGIAGTGFSYRKKLTDGYGGLLGNLINKVKGKKQDKEEETAKENTETPQIENGKVDDSVVKEYLEQQEANLHIHKYCDDVLNKEEIAKRINELDSEASKQVYELAVNGDEDTIESLVGAFLDNLELGFEVKANYELEDHQLYVDLDLPEIEDFKDEYPTLVKDKVVYKKKTSSELKEEYANIVISLGIYLASNFFNVSSYIDEVVLSAFTSRRNSDGDLVDEYLYSVKYTRPTFEETDFAQLEDTYNFLLKFENRINMSTNFVFKAIKPYEIPSVEKTNSLIDDAIAGLKGLGYKNADINNIIPKLNECSFATSGEYLKEALKLLAENK